MLFSVQVPERVQSGFLFVSPFPQEPIRLDMFSRKSKTYSKALLIFSAMDFGIGLLKKHHLSINISPASAFMKVLYSSSVFHPFLYILTATSYFV